MLGAHHRGMLKTALACGGVFYATSRSHYRSLGTLRGLGYFDKVTEPGWEWRDIWYLTRKGVRVASDLAFIDARKEKVR